MINMHSTLTIEKVCNLQPLLSGLITGMIEYLTTSAFLIRSMKKCDELLDSDLLYCARSAGQGQRIGIMSADSDKTDKDWRV